MAVMFSSREGSTEITQDRSVLLAAIDGMEGRQRVRRPHQGAVPQKAPLIAFAGSDEVKLAAIQEAQRASVSNLYDNVQHFETLTGAAKMLLQEDRRRKAFVLVSEGFDADLSRLADGRWRLMVEMTPRSTSDAGVSTPPFLADQAALENAMDALRRANVALYAIDLTGGLNRILDDLDHDYLLGFYPPDSIGGQVARPVDLKCRAIPTTPFDFAGDIRPTLPRRRRQRLPRHHGPGLFEDAADTHDDRPWICRWPSRPGGAHADADARRPRHCRARGATRAHTSRDRCRFAQHHTGRDGFHRQVERL